MSTETLTPVPLNPHTAGNHDVIRGEVVAPENNEDFFDATFDNQEDGERKKRAKKTVESIAPENIHISGEVVLSDVIAIREIMKTEEFETYSKDEQKEALETLLDELTESHQNKENDVYVRHRGELKDMLTASDKKFETISRSKEVHQARIDGVKLKRAKPVKSEKGSLSILEGGDQIDANEKTRGVSPARLRRNIKKLDKSFNGLLGDVAETGTKPAYLETKYQEFNEAVASHGENVNGKTRRSVERETLRKLIHANDLADRKGLEGDDRKEYENELVDMFHRYTQLTDDERETFSAALDTRQHAAKELARIQREEVASSAEKNEKNPVTSRLKAALGATAGKLMTSGKQRWETRKQSRDSNEEQLALFDEEPYATRRQSKAAKLRGAKDTLINMPQAGYHNLSARLTERRLRRDEKLTAMSDDEREAYDKKHERRHKAAMIGGTALAVIGVGLAMKYGLDHFNGPERPSTGDNQGGGLGDILNIPDLFDDPKIVEPGTDFGPTIPEGNGGTDTLTRNELFDGSGGSRRMTGENAQNLDKFLDSYTVRDSDNRGVWGISEKYLRLQGVSNPTVFEIDAVKDHILRHSSLTNSSIIYPGDTIKLK